MKLSKIPLVTSFYKDEDRDWSVQDCVNYLPTVSESAGTRSQMMLRTAPGLRPFVRLPGVGPVRGVYNCEGRLFAVMGEMLYHINNSFIAIPIGRIPGIQRVQFAHNQASSTGANQLVIGNGQAGYVYNTQTKVFERITDEGFIGGISPVFIDSYIVWVSLNRLYALNSSPADALEYNTLDQFQSEVSPDKLVGLVASSSELILMSETSLEFFQNTGATEQPFRTKQISLDLGLAGRFCIAKCDFSVFFLANDGTFRRIDNYTATRISTGPVEQAIRGLDWTQAYTYVLEEGRYKVVYWTFPDGKTFGWDIANQAWHRRESYGLNRWRVSDITKWNGLNIAGDFQDGTLWVVDSAYMMEGDQDFMCEISGPVIHADGNLAKMPRLDVIMQTGQQDTEPTNFPVQPASPTISGDAPGGIVGLPYGPYAYTVTPGANPVVSVTVSSGELPPGITLSNSGVLTAGELTEAATKTFTVRVTDSIGLFTEISDSIAIRAAVSGDMFKVNLYTGNGVQPRVLTTLDFSRGGSYLVRPRAVGWPQMMWANTPGPANMKSFAGSATEVPSINQITATGVAINTPILNTLSTNYFGYSFANFSKFAKTVTWVGDGNTTKDIAHGLGITPGAILVIHPANANYIDMYHRSLGPTQYLPMNAGSPLTTTPTAWGDTAPNATTFRVGSRYNATSVVYTALVLAHDDTATGFIQCGSYVGNGAAAGPAVSLGWQPQMLLVRAITGGSNQFVTDTTRSPGFTGNDELAYVSVSNNVSNNFNLYELIPGGFRPGSTFSESNANGATHIYVAVRA